MMRRRIMWLTFWVTMAFWLGFGLAGCHSANESARLGSTTGALPALGSGYEVSFAATPSVEGIDRSNWEPITVHVSADDSRSWPTYGRYCMLNQDERGPRARGDWPTLDSSIRTSQGSGDDDDDVMLYLEIPYQAAHQFGNMIAIPVYFITRTCEGVMLYGPRDSYERGMPGGADEIVLFPKSKPESESEMESEEDSDMESDMDSDTESGATPDAETAREREDEKMNG
jgi:hypothetical protein